jgi:cell division protein FtsB
LAFVASYQRDNKHYVESPAVEETQEELTKKLQSELSSLKEENRRLKSQIQELRNS